MKLSKDNRFAKMLDDRLSIIEDSYGKTNLNIPINVLQARMVDSVEEIGLTYLLNYQTIRLGNAINISIYGKEFYPVINKAMKDSAETSGIKLEINEAPSYVTEVVNRRRSIRKYSGKAISLNALSNIIVGSQSMHENQGFILKTTPSGGGLYPIELYFYAKHIEGLQEGLYKYEAVNQILKLIKSGGYSKVKEILSNQVVLDIEHCAGIFFFVYDYEKNYQKYGDLAMGLGFIETGCIAQTIHILSVDNHVGTCDIGGFDKPLSEEWLGVDGINKHCIYSIICGGLQDA